MSAPKILSFTIAFFIIAVASFGAEKSPRPLKQWVYEDVKGIVCPDASFIEANALLKTAAACGSKNIPDAFESLDAGSEYLNFSGINSLELNNVTCAENDISAILLDPDLQKKLTDDTCAKLPLLRSLVKKRKQFQKDLESWKKIANPMIRPIKAADMARYRQKIAQIEKELKQASGLIGGIENTDKLIDDRHVKALIYDELDDADPQTLCAILKKNAPVLLKKSLSELKDSKQTMTRAQSTGDYPTRLKKDLWASHSREQFVSQLSLDNPPAARAITCRMEARYGEGAKITEDLFMLATSGLAIEIGMLGKLGGILYAGRAAKAYRAAKTVFYAELALSAGANAVSLNETCFDGPGLASTSGERACAAEGPTDSRTHIFKEMNSNSCMLAVLLAGISSAGSLAGADGFLKNSLLSRTLAQRTQNTPALSRRLAEAGLYDGIEVTKKTTTSRGVLVTVAQKPGAKGMDPTNFDARNVVLSPEFAIDTLEEAAPKLGYKMLNDKTAQIPDYDFLNSRIAQFNSGLPPEKQITVRFYKTGSKAGSNKEYLRRYKEHGALPFADTGQPGSAFRSGHLGHHDSIFHGPNVTMPREMVQNTQHTLQLAEDFEKFISAKHPDLKKTLDFNRLEDLMTKQLDSDSGTWGVNIQTLKQAGSASARPVNVSSDYTERYSVYANATPAERLKRFVIQAAGRGDLEVQNALEEFARSLPQYMRRKPFGDVTFPEFDRLMLARHDEAVARFSSLPE